MSEQIVPWAAWAGLAVLAILALPIGCCQRFVLGVSSWALRLTLFAVLAGGAYLYFRPNEMPAQVNRVLDASPGLLTILPERSAAHFGLCLACLIVASLLPLLMALDVTRSLAGRRLRRLKNMADGWVEVVSAPRHAAPVPVAEVESAPMGVPVMRPIDRRTACTVISSTGSRIPVAPTR